MSESPHVMVPNTPPAESNAPAGWVGLINEAIALLDREFRSWRLIQVKQKFGCLRIYYLSGSDDSDQEARVAGLIRQIEARSEKVCDICAAPAAPGADDYRRRTRCNGHQGVRDVDAEIVIRSARA